MRILAISGSLRDGSYSGGLLRAAQELAPGGSEVELYEGLADLAFYNEDIDSEDTVPAEVSNLREKIGDADALLIATPEYNGSVPGALKNALDWASRPHGGSALAGKPAAVIGSSLSPFGAAWAQDALRRVLTISGSAVLERELTIGRVDERFTDGRLTDIGTHEEIAVMIADLVELVGAREAEEAVAA
jgi:chromate reductase